MPVKSSAEEPKVTKATVDFISERRESRAACSDKSVDAGWSILLLQLRADVMPADWNELNGLRCGSHDRTMPATARLHMGRIPNAAKIPCCTRPRSTSGECMRNRGSMDRKDSNRVIHLVAVRTP
jgi:hypothetical protein